MLDRTRNDKAKVKEDIKAEVIGLYNKYGESS